MILFPLHFCQLLICHSIGLNAIGNHIIYRAGFNVPATDIHSSYIDGLTLDILSTTLLDSIYITGIRHINIFGRHIHITAK